MNHICSAPVHIHLRDATESRIAPIDDRLKRRQASEVHLKIEIKRIGEYKASINALVIGTIQGLRPVERQICVILVRITDFDPATVLEALAFKTLAEQISRGTHRNHDDAEAGRICRLPISDAQSNNCSARSRAGGG